MKNGTRGLFGSLSTNLRCEMKIQYGDQKTIVLPPYLASESFIRLFTTPECAAWRYTVRNVCNFSIQGYIKFPICLLNLPHLVILVYSGILNFLSVH